MTLDLRERGMTNETLSILLIGASGYIGSRLAQEFAAEGWRIVGCDRREPRDPSHFTKFHQSPYSKLSDQAIANTDVVVWFAGHSSVKRAQEAPWESLENNIFELAALFRRVGELGRPVIYASSASVLSSSDDEYSLVASEVSSNAYDAGKLAFDILTPHLGVNCLGLRMATVSGWSPATRWDLIFNAMNKSAYLERIVHVSNQSSFRSLLFIEDLFRFVQVKAVEINGSPFFGARHSALASWSGAIGQLAAEIADFWNVPLEFQGGLGTYSFMLSDRELAQACREPAGFYRSIKSRCREFAGLNGWKAPA